MFSVLSPEGEQALTLLDMYRSHKSKLEPRPYRKTTELKLALRDQQMISWGDD